MKRILLILFLFTVSLFSQTYVSNTDPTTWYSGTCPVSSIIVSTSGVSYSYDVRGSLDSSAQISSLSGVSSNSFQFFKGNNEEIQCTYYTYDSHSTYNYRIDHYFYQIIGVYNPPPTCSQNQHLDTNTNTCVPDCTSGQISDGNGTCCDAGTADSIYNVDQTTCESSSSLYVDTLSYYTNINWNSCLNKCVATSNSCPKNKVFNQQGYCVDPTIDPTNCEAAGGTLQNFTYEQVGACILNHGPAIDPCCTYEAECIKPDGTVILTPDVYVSCQGSNTSTPDLNTSTPDLNTTNTDLNTTNNNQCTTCPSQYPLPDDNGNCKNSNGDILACPTIDYNNTNPTLTCGTCSLLSGGWTSSDNGMCQHTTVNGVIQYAACPTDPTDPTIDPTTDNPNPSPDSNISYDSNTSLANGQDSKSVCTNCPSGYKNIGGSCGIISTTGQVLSFIPCPGVPSTVDSNGTDPLADQNGTEDNATGNLDQFGNAVGNEIKKAYKNYSIFNTTDCGELQVSADVHLFNQPNAVIKDPIPMFRDIMAPYRNIIKGFLIFIAGIIGLFDFFRRS